MFDKRSSISDWVGRGEILSEVIDPLVIQQLNGKWTLEFTHICDKYERWKTIVPDKIIVASTQQGRQPFRVKRISRTMDGVHVEAEHIFF